MTKKGPVEKVLALFADVRTGEAGTTLLLMLNVFTLLTTYYIIKPVREALILTTPGGPELKAYMAPLQGLILLGAVPLYGILARHAARRRLINSVTLFFTACLVAFFFLAQSNVPIGIAFYLWIGVFNLMVVAQFWSFANDLYTPEQGKRLFAIVGFGASAGAVLGSKIAGALIEPIGINRLLLLAAGLLVASLAITNVVDARESRPRAAGAGGVARDESPITEGGALRAFELVVRHRYLLLIALLTLLVNWVNTSGEYILGRTVSQAAKAAVASGQTGGLTEREFVGKFYSDFQLWVNIFSVCAQLFLVSRILKYVGVRAALLFLPIIAFTGYLIIAFVPVLAMVRWAKTAENATDYSLQGTLRGVLFLPTTREEKYMAKQATDTFFWRAGDALQALVVWLGTAFWGFQTREFALFNLVLVGVWITVAVALGRHHRKLTGRV